MKTRYWLVGAGCLALFVAGVVAFLGSLARSITQLKQNHERMEAQLAELRADVDAANTELLVLRAEADLRQEQLRRLLEDDRDDDWRGLN